MNLVFALCLTPSLPPQHFGTPRQVVSVNYCSGHCTCGCQSGAACACGETKRVLPPAKAATPTYTQPAFAPFPAVQYMPRSGLGISGRGCAGGG